MACVCVLCRHMAESINHLFFWCEFAAKIWHVVIQRNGISRRCSSWEEEVRIAVGENRGDSFGACVRNLSLAASEYFMRQRKREMVESSKMLDSTGSMF